MSMVHRRLPSSLLIRLPLLAAILVILATLLMAAGLGWLTHRYLLEDVDSGANQAIAVWSKSLPALIQQDNVWGVFESLTSVTSAGAPQVRSIAIVLKPNGAVFASSDPHQFPTDRLPNWSTLWNTGAPKHFAPNPAAPASFIQSGQWRIYTRPLLSESGQPIATLIYAVNDMLYQSRLLSMLWWIAGITILAAAVFVPLLWMLSRHMLRPLARLRHSMTLDSEQAQRTGTALSERADEIGALAHAFTQLLGQVEQARQAEKLAAVGTLAAATAHEINNPLGGMINALTTAKRFGTYDETTQGTLELLERGLEQLHTIAQALLAQTRPTERDLSRRDLLDVAELIEPCLHEHQLQLQTQFEVPEQIPVASGPVRQATLNILLNACHAAQPGSTLQFFAELIPRVAFHITVRNRGAAPPTPILQRLESSTMPTTAGFGLWQSRRLLIDIGGNLTLKHDCGWTTARIEIPLRSSGQSRG